MGSIQKQMQMRSKRNRTRLPVSAPPLYPNTQAVMVAAALEKRRSHMMSYEHACFSKWLGRLFRASSKLSKQSVPLVQLRTLWHTDRASCTVPRAQSHIFTYLYSS